LLRGPAFALRASSGKLLGRAGIAFTPAFAPLSAEARSAEVEGASAGEPRPMASSAAVRPP